MQSVWGSGRGALICSIAVLGSPLSEEKQTQPDGAKALSANILYTAANGYRSMEDAAANIAGHYLWVGDFASANDISH